MNRLFLVLPFLLTNIFSQSFIREINTIPFEAGGTELKNVFSGGTNNPEFQFVDIDADGDLDLFVLSSDGKFDLFNKKY